MYHNYIILIVYMFLCPLGPISVCLDATTWSTYVSGTVTNCDGNTVNHCVQIVGVYYSSATDTGFYKVRNSWVSIFVFLFF